MKSLFLLGILAFLVQGISAKTIKEIYREYKDSVVLLTVAEKNGKTSHGTAFAIDQKGETFLTAAHVLSGSNKIKVLNNRNQYYKVKHIVFIDPDTDLAIIKTIKPTGCKPIPLDTYTKVEVGEKLAIISYPRALEAGGAESTLSHGLLSSIRSHFISERILMEERPIYNKQEPVIFAATLFFKRLYQDCKTLKKVNLKTKPQKLKCLDGKLALIDHNTVLYSNFDLAIKNGDLVYYFANQNQALLSSVKAEGLMLQYTAPISPGSSGGPIFNEQGQVIAVVNSFLDHSQNINYGRPIDYLPTSILRHNQIATGRRTKPSLKSLKASLKILE